MSLKVKKKDQHYWHLRHFRQKKFSKLAKNGDTDTSQVLQLNLSNAYLIGKFKELLERDFEHQYTS